MVNSKTFLTIWWKAPFWLLENQKKIWIFRGIQFEDRQIQSAPVYTMDWPGPVICMYLLCYTKQARNIRLGEYLSYIPRAWAHSVCA